jgi:hypothetical protein
MLLAAADEMNIDLSQSWSIGDSSRDVEAGLNAGCKTILISRYSRKKSAYGEPNDPKPDYKSVNMKEAVNIIKQYHRSSNGAKAKTQPIPGAKSQPEPEPESQAEPESEPKPVKGSKSKSAPKSKTKLKKQKKLKRKSFLKSKPKPAPVTESEPVPEPESKPEAELGSQPVPEAESKAYIEPESKPTPEPETKLAFNTVKQLKQQQTNQIEQEGAPVGIEQMLKTILGQLKSMQRDNMFSEFSFFRVVAGALQIIVVFCLLVTLGLLMRPARQDNLVLVSLGFAMVLQMMSLTFYIMQGRK